MISFADNNIKFAELLLGNEYKDASSPSQNPSPIFVNNNSKLRIYGMTNVKNNSIYNNITRILLSEQDDKYITNIYFHTDISKFIYPFHISSSYNIYKKNEISSTVLYLSFNKQKCELFNKYSNDIEDTSNISTIEIYSQSYFGNIDFRESSDILIKEFTSYTASDYSITTIEKFYLYNKKLSEKLINILLLQEKLKKDLKIRDFILFKSIIEEMKNINQLYSLILEKNKESKKELKRIL